MRRPLPAFLLLSPLAALAQSTPAQIPPIQVALPEPATLDLRAADPGALVPADNRDPAQVEAARKAWIPLLAPVKGAAAVRILLPGSGPREALLLAAAQALRAEAPQAILYVGDDPGAPPLLSEAAWGAVDGGALTAEALGADPAAWRDRLAEAQARFPGRPWTLWLPVDPGPSRRRCWGTAGG